MSATTAPDIEPVAVAGRPAASSTRQLFAARWIVLAVVLAADVMDLLDSTIVNVAGPTIRRNLGGGASTLQWLGAAYTLTFAVLLVTGARLGDIFGRRRLFLVGSAGFTAMSAACALAPSSEVLIGLRALQGGFGALLIPQGFGLLKEVFPEEEMGKVFATFGPVMGLSAIASPILAGLLIAADLFGTGWRLVFLINVPVGIIALVAAAKVLPRGAATPGAKLDLIGMVLLGLASVGIIYPLIEGHDQGWPLWIFAFLAAGAVLLMTFLAYERRRRDAPLIDPGLLRNRAYTDGIMVALAFFATFSGLILVISLFCQLGERFSPIHTGLTVVPLTVGMVLSMVISFALVARFGRHLLHAGILLSAAGSVTLALTVSGAGSASSSALAPGLLISGLGAGLVFGQLFDIILAGVAMDEVGSASGVLNAVQQLANALGVAVLGTVFFSALDGGHLPTSALATAAWVALAPLAVTFALAFRLPMQAREGGGH
ncbi:MAG TPA: MFS transporter [Solirubrobacteraceae bacterium]|jgi:EmrB/QacA subfamily drug resistance transporter|nr:MFS transporter [Solirubrobacteraceae bacterium]